MRWRATDRCPVAAPCENALADVARQAFGVAERHEVATIAGVTFRDGVEVTDAPRQSAA